MIHRRGRGTMNHSTRWEVQKGKGVGRNEEMTNFYFSKFSYSYGAKQMFEIFHEYGLIEEVVIPPKRNKNEKIFGFVRFRKVLDARNLEVKLDNIFIKSKKIYVNIPKFQHGRMEAPDGKQSSRDFEHNKGIGMGGGENYKQGFMTNNTKKFGQVVRDHGTITTSLKMESTWNRSGSQSSVIKIMIGNQHLLIFSLI